MRQVNWKVIAAALGALLCSLWILGTASAQDNGEALKAESESALPSNLPALVVPGVPSAKEVPSRTEAAADAVLAHVSCDCLVVYHLRSVNLGRVVGFTRDLADRACRALAISKRHHHGRPELARCSYKRP